MKILLIIGAIFVFFIVLNFIKDRKDKAGDTANIVLWVSRVLWTGFILILIIGFFKSGCLYDWSIF